MSVREIVFRGALLKAIGFDVDDTLLLSELLKQLGLMVSNTAHEFVGRGQSVRPEDLLKFIGVSQDQWETLGPEVLGLNWKSIKRARDESLRQMLAENQIPWTPGAEDFLDWLVSIEFPRGRYTTTKRKPMGEAIAAQSNLDSYLPVALYGDDVPKGKGKPDPEGYLMLARQLGVAPEEMLVVEDSPRGAKAAFDAGCFLVVVPGMAPFTDAEREMAHVEYGSLKELHRDLQVAVMNQGA